MSPQLLSGVEAGSIMVMLFNPLWVVRTRMALQGAETLQSGQKRYTGMIGELYHYVSSEVDLDGSVF